MSGIWREASCRGCVSSPLRALQNLPCPAALQLMPRGLCAKTHERYPLVTGPTGEPTKRVHVFGQKWLIQGEDYEAVWYHDGQ